MTKQLIPTTTIGSFPKPKYLPVRDWFDAAREEGGMSSSAVTKDYTVTSQALNETDEVLFQQAAKEIIDIQLNAGVTIPTDGEVRRENYIHYHCRHLSGFDFQQLEHRVLRDGAYEADLPAITGLVKQEGPAYAVKDYLAAQKFCPVPLKFTLPGPLTIMDTNADCFYHDRKKLNHDLAETINKEILSLVDVGCKHIQVDEPLFARQIDDAVSFGFEGLEHCFHRVPEDVTRIVHMCCGYPDHLDDEDYKKADRDSYFKLASYVDDAGFDQLSIEDAHCRNDLTLLDKFSKKTIIFGAVAVARSRVETIEEIKARLEAALNHIDRERLVVAPDCGLGLLPPAIAAEKLTLMVKATKLV